MKLKQIARRAAPYALMAAGIGSVGKAFHSLDEMSGFESKMYGQDIGSLREEYANSLPVPSQYDVARKRHEFLASKISAYESAVESQDRESTLMVGSYIFGIFSLAGAGVTLFGRWRAK